MHCLDTKVCTHGSFTFSQFLDVSKMEVFMLIGSLCASSKMGSGLKSTKPKAGCCIDPSDANIAETFANIIWLCRSLKY